MSRTVSRSYPPFEGFDVIRREIVAHIEPDPNGTVGPLTAAYSAIGHYFEENDGPQPMSVEFTVFDRTFHASVDMEPRYQDWLKEQNT